MTHTAVTSRIAALARAALGVTVLTPAALCVAALVLVGCESTSASTDAGLDAAMDAHALDGGDDDAQAADADIDAGDLDGGPRDGGYRDPALVAECIACHTTEGAAWESHLSSHRLLLFCTTCHTTSDADAGASHATSRACAGCHSNASHPSADVGCTTCHDPHGTANVYLVVEQLELPDAGSRAIHFTALEGASVDGLARDGVPDAAVGTGLCEVCHTTTAHYAQTGSPVSHFRSLCSDCHGHDVGFGPPPP